MPIVLKFGSLKLLEPPGPVQAYNGIALHFIIAVTSGFDRFCVLVDVEGYCCTISPSVTHADTLGGTRDRPVDTQHSQKTDIISPAVPASELVHCCSHVA